jgi:uncharacterized membrane protein HdeD (DUF308 family)
MTTDTLSRDVSRHAGWSIFMGILTAAVGAAMIIYPLATAAASTVFFGSERSIVWTCREGAALASSASRSRASGWLNGRPLGRIWRPSSHIDRP